MNKEQKQITKVLKLINSIYSNYEEVSPDGRGKKVVYGEMELFKIFVVMKLTNINTIKGIWRYLLKNKKIKKLCGLENDIDRSTLSRRLSDRAKLWFE